MTLEERKTSSLAQIKGPGREETHHMYAHVFGSPPL